MKSFGDRFVIERELGRGGMGEVLLAHDKHLDRRVAAKVLPVALSTMIGGDRFAREIRLTARLVHPNIVPLFDSTAISNRKIFSAMVVGRCWRSLGLPKTPEPSLGEAR